jgi:hypothetical protein
MGGDPYVAGRERPHLADKRKEPTCVRRECMKVQVVSVRAKVDQRTEAEERWIGKEQQMDVQAAVQLSTNDRACPEQVAYALKDPEDTVFLLSRHYA